MDARHRPDRSAPRSLVQGVQKTMNKQLVLAAAVALLTALGVPSALAAATPVSPANGNDVELPNGSVYQGNDDGTFSWIPDVATADAMGIDWSNLAAGRRASRPRRGSLPVGARQRRRAGQRQRRRPPQRVRLPGERRRLVLADSEHRDGQCDGHRLGRAPAGRCPARPGRGSLPGDRHSGERRDQPACHGRIASLRLGPHRSR